ncbi:coenzyme F420 hydrogenase subunit beta [Nitratiruptor sp. YY08-26]|uniref:Coenzyme F420 hydrogenase/dehydrogenase, beta subunit C-terminal domain n=1 Tax=unclassified Nitratiruptor TaxID=2624044 RepID=UPI0019151A30|nr:MULTISPECIES: Coenzyme F420 hydrogenase/dehydrogenase, beta subunit C-terminal domain [unclassified Nitratiruptor]BCD62075.1 coenzyme F420 hydrogenase subunit beta [Nitratiruptor sp. YY08-13]BCD66011.1 coenzyme F420 hydrogenase subunit beta [Nitratiruptor sp. YY08-26]
MERHKNVSFVSQDFMCTGCGTCVAVCPHNVISMELDEKKGVYQSYVDLQNCTNCTICLKSCPPITWTNEKKNNNSNEIIGNFLASYATYSNNKKIREDSASGGFITSLLIFLLENRLIDGAVVVKRDKKNPLISKPFIATNVQDLKDAKGSKYSPVKFDEIIKEILNSSYSKLAVVGLPCHIEGIAKASKNNKKLKNAIKYKISIVCGQNPSFLSYEYIAKKFNISLNDIKELKNRGDGWPGFMQIKTKDRDIKIPYGSKYSMGMVLSSPLFTPLSCQMCVDPIGFEADVSVGDAWLNKYMKEKNDGVNLILVKNNGINNVLQRMKQEGVITLLEETVDSFIKANESMIYNKVILNKYKIRLFAKNYNLFSQNFKISKNLTFSEKMRSLIFVLHLKVIKKLNLKKIIPYINDIVLFYLKIINLLKNMKD